MMKGYLAIVRGMSYGKNWKYVRKDYNNKYRMFDAFNILI